MFGKNRLVIDTLAGATLCLALLMVFLVDRVTKPAGTVTTTGANTLAVQVVHGDPGKGQAQKRVVKKLRLAVTPTFTQKVKSPGGFQKVLWDDMGKLLREMGDDYQFDEVQPKDFADNPELLDSYDVVFLTCHPRTVNLHQALVRFVERGGTLYASDWRFDDVAEAFPHVVDRSQAGSGTRQHVRADVVDEGLREYIGPHITLDFDLPEWKTAAFAGPDVTPLLTGRYNKQRNNRDAIGFPAEAPLLVKFKSGKGTVIFTSFHNEKQNSAVEKKLLQYLVFTLVVADIEAQVTASIEQAGFAPQKSNLLSTPRESSITRTYQNARVGPLRVSLGFREAGAELQLVIKAPDGRSFVWKGSSTVTLEVAEAMVGEWTYTVTAVKVPDNFPFTVTISQKK